MFDWKRHVEFMLSALLWHLNIGKKDISMCTLSLYKLSTSQAADTFWKAERPHTNTIQMTKK